MTTFRSMVDFIKSAWPARSFIVPCLRGTSGIGKTDAVAMAASELKQEYEEASGDVTTIILSQSLPNEVSGITMPDVEKRAMFIFDHYRLGNLKDGDILFFDELLEADQLVLSACLTLIESRQLMSGNKLPDIMIVAATNPTIKPNMLKENIRQRFVWRDFSVDPNGCAKYILDTYGFNVDDLVSRLESDGDEYNILTPRSFTKMARWISCCTSDEERERIASQINTIWKSDLGSGLLHCYNKTYKDNAAMIAKSIGEAFEHAGKMKMIVTDEVEGPQYNIDGINRTIVFSADSFKDDNLEETMAVLSSLPGWDKMQEYLSSLECPSEAETYDKPIEF